MKAEILEGNSSFVDGNHLPFATQPWCNSFTIDFYVEWCVSEYLGTIFLVETQYEKSAARQCCVCKYFIHATVDNRRLNHAARIIVLQQSGPKDTSHILGLFKADTRVVYVIISFVSAREKANLYLDLSPFLILLPSCHGRSHSFDDRRRPVPLSCWRFVSILVTCIYLNIGVHETTSDKLI